MIYQARINKHVSNIRVYVIMQRIGPKENFLTRLFIKMFGQEKRFEGTDDETAIKRLK